MNEPGNLEAADGIAVEYAGFWRRAAAALIDLMILLVGLLLINVVSLVGTFVVASLSFSLIAGGSMAYTLGTITVEAIPYVAIVVGPWLYFSLFERSGQQATPGKLTLGIKVVDYRARRVSFWRASGRHWAKALSAMTGFVGFAFAGFTARKQALHDMVTGTLVVRGTPARPVPLGSPATPSMLIGVGLVLALVGLVAGYLLLAYLYQVMKEVFSNAVGITPIG